MSNRTLIGQIEFDIVSLSDTEAEGEMQIGPGILSPLGTVHAGALIWFADVVATSLVLGGEQVEESMDSFPVAESLTAQMLTNRQQGTLTARAVWLRRGPRMATVRTTVTDEDGTVLLDLTSSHANTARDA